MKSLFVSYFEWFLILIFTKKITTTKVTFFTYLSNFLQENILRLRRHYRISFASFPKISTSKCFSARNDFPFASSSICHFFVFRFPTKIQNRVSIQKSQKLNFLLSGDFSLFNFSPNENFCLSILFNPKQENALTRPQLRARQSNLFTQWVHKHYWLRINTMKIVFSSFFFFLCFHILVVCRRAFRSFS